MRVYYSTSPIDKSVSDEYEHSLFLAGPTPRSDDVESWRPTALQILEELEYDGLVWVPEGEPGDPKFCGDYIHQVKWEKWGLTTCKIIVFWVPRSIPDMPAFTTNVEFGRYVDSGRAIYGRPDEAVKCGYLDWLYMDAIHCQPYNDLNKILKAAIRIRD